MWKLTKLRNPKKSTISPTGFKEYGTYYRIGDKYVRILTISQYPYEFVEGLLVKFVADPDFDIDMLVEHSDLDIASALKKQMHQFEMLYERSSDPQEKSRLRYRYTNLKNFIDRNVRQTSTTVNVCINIYIKADTLEGLNEKTKYVRDGLEASTYEIKTRTVSYLQQSYFKKNSPLFVENGMNADENFLLGQPMDSISCAALWPFVYDTLEDPDGTLIGHELSTNGKVIFNQFLWHTHPQIAKMYNRSSGNTIIVGRTGMGKTVLMNMILMGHLMHHRKIVWIDPEDKNYRLTTYVGGAFISFGDGKKIINIFDLKPISNDDGRSTKEEMYNTRLAITNVVEEIKVTFKMLWKNIGDDELSMISEIVYDTYASVGITFDQSFEHLGPEDYPTFDNFTAILEEKIRSYSNAKNCDIEVDALKHLQMRMRSITGHRGIEGEWGRFFNGTTSITADEMKKNIISFGTKSLINVSRDVQNALLRMIFQYAWSVCLENIDMSVLAIDEEHMFITEPYLADLLAVIQRRTRKYCAATLTGTQEVHDYCNDKILNAGKAIFDNATYQIYMNLTLDGINDLSKLINLTLEEKNTILNLPVHCGLMCIENKRIPVRFLATEEELQLIP